MNYHDRAQWDVYIAELLISPAGNPQNAQGAYDLAAFHAQQAIEKELKHILHDLFGVDDSTRSFRIHNLVDLAKQVSQLGITLPDDLFNQADEISDWEAESRYSSGTVATKEDIKSAISIYDKVAECARNIAAEKQQEQEAENKSADATNNEEH